MLQFYYVCLQFVLLYSCWLAAQEARNIFIVHPGQNVKLSCSLANTTENRQIIGWLVDHNGPYRVNSLRSRILAGYSSNILGISIIIQNIMINDRDSVSVCDNNK